MSLKDMIYKRQSCRNYLMDELDSEVLEDINSFIDNARRLDEDISFSYDILTNHEVSNLVTWKAPYYLALFSENKGIYKENIGFIFQQVDLYLHSIGIATCWLGMGRLKSSYKKVNPDHEFIILIAFGLPGDELYRDINLFERVTLDKISDRKDERLLPALYAPSAINSQPWYFVHLDDNNLRIYRKKYSILKRKVVEKWNKVDIGIALAHLYISSHDSFSFELEEDYEDIKGYYYEGKIRL